MDMLKYIVLILFTLVLSIRANSIYSLISLSKNYSSFYEIIQKERNQWRKGDLMSTPCTVFVPIDSSYFQNMNVRREVFIDTHIDRTVGNDIERLVITHLRRKQVPLWFSFIKENGKKTYFVNDAQVLDNIILSPSESVYQYMYPIDKPLVYDENRQIYTSLYDFIRNRSLNEKSKTKSIDWNAYIASRFLDAINKYQVKDLFQSCYKCTYFIFETLQYGIDITYVLLSAHVIKDKVLFTRSMGNETFLTKADTSRNKVLLSKEVRVNENKNKYIIILAHNLGYGNSDRGITYVKITQSDIPLENGVLHFISHPLTVIVKEIYEILNEESYNTLIKFMNIVKNSSLLKEIALIQTKSRNMTIFAFTDDAFDLVEHRFPPINSTEFLDLMKLHFIPDVTLTTSIVKGGIMAEAFDGKENISLSLYNERLYVDARGVMAKAIKQDILAKAGVIHIVNKVLGITTSLIIDRINEDQEFELTAKVVKGWASRLSIKDTNCTFLAPSNSAWERLRYKMPSLFKQITLNIYPKNTEVILNRHLIIDRIINFDDLIKIADNNGIIKTSSSTTLSVHKKNEFGRDIISLKWFDTEIEITRADIQALNGIIHEIDDVLMVESDMKVSEEEARVELTSSGNMIIGLMWLMITLFTCSMIIV